MAQRIKIKSGSSGAASLPLLTGEPAYSINDNKLYIGNGSSVVRVDAGSYTAECSTAKDIAAKTVNCTGFILFKGVEITIKFTVDNTAAVSELTLNVGGTGAKPIRYRGTNLLSPSTLSKDRVYKFYYGGNNWELIGDLDIDTTVATELASHTDNSEIHITSTERTNWNAAYGWGNHASAGYAAASALSSHTGNTSNPHGVTKSQVELGNVENIALSTWTGSTKIKTLGTITTGTWNAGVIGVLYGGTGKNSVGKNSMLYAFAANSYAEVTTSPFGRGLLNATSETKVTGLNADQIDGYHAEGLWRTDNAGSKSYDWSAKNLTLAGSITGATTGAFSSNVTIGGTLGVTGKTTLPGGLFDSTNSAITFSYGVGITSGALTLEGKSTMKTPYIDFFHYNGTGGYSRIIEKATKELSIYGGASADGKIKLESDTYVEKALYIGGANGAKIVFVPASGNTPAYLKLANYDDSVMHLVTTGGVTMYSQGVPSGGTGGGATVILNGETTEDPTFWAPTSAGSSLTTQFLKASGSGAPVWADFPTTWAWSALTGVPDTFAPSAHTHLWAHITDKPSTFTPSAHTLGSHSDVTISSIASGEILKWNGTKWINNTLAEAGISASSHSHSWTEITSKPPTFTPSTHSHSIAQVTGLQTALDGKVDDSQVLTNVPLNAKFTDTVYTHPSSHPISFITGLQTALNGKEPSFTKNTAFNKNFGTSAGTVAVGNDSRIINGQTAFDWGDHALAGYAAAATLSSHTGKTSNPHSVTKSQVGLGNVLNVASYSKTESDGRYLPFSGGTLTGDLSIRTGNTDKYITFDYSGNNTYNWRIGYLGTGTGDANYFTIQSSKSTGGVYFDALRLGLETLNAQFFGTVTAPTFSGSLSGNASTATTLATTRAINGTNFNGSAAITTARWGTARNISIGGTSKSVNGSANVTWATSEIAAQSAIQLAATRIIWGQSFNGTENISGAITGATTGSFSSTLSADRIVVTSTSNEKHLEFSRSDYNYITSKGHIGFITGGTGTSSANQQVWIHSNGNTKIGAGSSSVPAYTLDVNGTGRYTSNLSVGGTLGVTGKTTLSTATITSQLNFGSSGKWINYHGSANLHDVNAYNLSIKHETPFIDFYFNGATNYTSRIIEQTSGVLDVIGAVKIPNTKFLQIGSAKLVYVPSSGDTPGYLKLQHFNDSTPMHLVTTGGQTMYSTGVPAAGGGGGATIQLNDVIYGEGSTAKIYSPTGPGYPGYILKAANPSGFPEWVNISNLLPDASTSVKGVVKLSGTGNATTVAKSDHNHSAVYAAYSHTHSGYAAANHEHETITGILAVGKGGTGATTPAGALNKLGAAAASHTHSGYASTSHDHNGVYASYLHTHSGYAAASHGHAMLSGLQINYTDSYSDTHNVLGYSGTSNYDITLGNDSYKTIINGSPIVLDPFISFTGLVKCTNGTLSIDSNTYLTGITKTMVDAVSCNADTVDSLHASSFLRSDAANSSDIAFSTTSGMGLRFWNNNNHKIFMAATPNTTYGGNMSGVTADYNMYFRIGDGTNRGFVFESSYSVKHVSINPDGMRTFVPLTVRSRETSYDNSQITLGHAEIKYRLGNDNIEINKGLRFTAGTIQGAVIGNYGVCSTAVGTVAKAVTISGFRLATGVQINVKFSNDNYSYPITLNVSNTGAKTVKAYGDSSEQDFIEQIKAGAVIPFVYDGTYWVIPTTPSMY